MMKSSLISANSSSLISNFSRRSHVFDSFGRKKGSPDWNSNGFLKIPIFGKDISINSRIHRSRLITVFSTEAAKPSVTKSMETETQNDVFVEEEAGHRLNFEVRNPNFSTYLPTAKLSLSDQAFFLLAFIACTTSIAFMSLVIAAVPTLYAMGRAAISLSKLADTAREELPSTMAAIRLSGMEISDLTLELSDLSHEITDGVSKSAQAVQAAEAGIRKIGSLARQQTISMIQERASLPVISLQPVVAGAAKKTSRAVGRATKNFLNIISRREFSSGNDDSGIDRVEL